MAKKYVEVVIKVRVNPREIKAHREYLANEAENKKGEEYQILAGAVGIYDEIVDACNEQNEEVSK